MITLTTKEKADRYDALQAAIRFTAENYRARRMECLRNYEAYGADVSILGSYNKGMADAYESVLGNLERWNDS